MLEINKSQIIKLLKEIGLNHSKISIKSSYIFIEILLDSNTIDISFLPEFKTLFTKKISNDYLSFEAFISTEEEIVTMTVKISMR